MEDRWVYDNNGNLSYHYQVNGIACILWEYDGFYQWQYGNNIYILNDIYAYDNNTYVGYMTEDGDLHYQIG